MTFIILSYRFSFSAQRSNALEYTDQLVSQISKDIDGYIKYMQDISLMIVLNKDVEEYFKTKSVETFLGQYLEGRMQGLLNSIAMARTDITNIVIFGEGDKSTIMNSEDMKINSAIDPMEQDFYIDAVEADGEPVISSTHVQNIIDGKYTYVVSLSRLIKDTETGKRNGVVLVDLNYARISDLCSNISLGKKGYIFIVDENGDIVYHPQQQLIYSRLKSERIDEILERPEGVFEPESSDDNNEKKIYTIRECSYSNWRVVGVTYVDELVVNTKEMQRYYLLAAILFVLFGTTIAYYLAHRISMPIKNLEKSMSEFEKGDFDAKVSVISNDEVGELAKTYNDMTDRIKDLMNQNLIEHELKRKNELRVLQSQINPHFLYNTLDSIIWMAESGQSEDVILMTSALARLFRISISRGSELITIKNEIEYIKSYLTIQKMRYKDKINFDIDIEEPLLSAFMLKLLLQPLVENAIYHGIKNIDGKGTIKITGHESGGKVYLKVIDTGAGMSPETLSNVNRMLQKSESGADGADPCDYLPSEKGNGVGIINVHQRLKLYFGAEYGLSFESRYHEGTTATIVMPVLGSVENYSFRNENSYSKRHFNP